jgi:hypothetical protein
VRECLTCGRSFEASRSDACYCSDACRQKAYRDRRRESCNVTSDTERDGAVRRRIGAMTDATRRWLKSHKGPIASLKVEFRKGEGMTVK